MRWRRIVLAWGFWLPFGFTSYMAWTPVAHPEISQANDKFMHILAFGYLAGAFSIAYAHWTTWPRTAALMLAYAALIEVVQGLIPNRESSLLDFVADGIAIGLALSGLYVIHQVAGRLKQKTDVA
ncbi:VanZ family protein [Candidatus Entotheonella palauensis]|uniref:VanZ family protein n=1 Tax=Candidatus Entotheonella palauensis TaxID=93172 RepID=UPI001177B31B|nr:VanZ family protein [Candidatus Entotheonella palauensis]